MQKKSGYFWLFCKWIFSSLWNQSINDMLYWSMCNNVQHVQTVDGLVITKLRLLYNRLFLLRVTILSWIHELERKNSNTVNRMLLVSGAILVSAGVAMVTISWEIYSQSKEGKEVLQTVCTWKRRVEWHCVSGFTWHTSVNPKSMAHVLACTLVL